MQHTYIHFVHVQGDQWSHCPKIFLNNLTRESHRWAIFYFCSNGHTCYQREKEIWYNKKKVVFILLYPDCIHGSMFNLLKFCFAATLTSFCMALKHIELFFYIFILSTRNNFLLFLILFFYINLIIIHVWCSFINNYTTQIWKCTDENKRNKMQTNVQLDVCKKKYAERKSNRNVCVWKEFFTFSTIQYQHNDIILVKKKETNGFFSTQNSFQFCLIQSIVN